jgi:hypothetical protein
LTDVSEVLTASIIALMMKAASTPETSVNFYQTPRRDNPEDSHLLKNSVLTSKKTQPASMTTINWLMLFREIIAVYSENHTKHTNTTCRITDCLRRWYI